MLKATVEFNSVIIIQETMMTHNLGKHLIRKRINSDKRKNG